MSDQPFRDFGAEGRSAATTSFISLNASNSNAQIKKILPNFNTFPELTDGQTFVTATRPLLQLSEILCTDLPKVIAAHFKVSVLVEAGAGGRE